MLCTGCPPKKDNVFFLEKHAVRRVCLDLIFKHYASKWFFWIRFSSFQTVIKVTRKVNLWKKVLHKNCRALNDDYFSFYNFFLMLLWRRVIPLKRREVIEVSQHIPPLSCYLEKKSNKWSHILWSFLIYFQDFIFFSTCW